ncbi:hypothetical protein FH972_024177 [Carpinus fangiana]|uniref:Uncharacterized protein n=1 Tax=Carpinus fangiana TaxID=176857 RepID=A0A5N6KXM5_9ROSI|nr:hypothetical protein FH972_024177 [Carpinus fangiana]
MRALHIYARCLLHMANCSIFLTWNVLRGTKRNLDGEARQRKIHVSDCGCTGCQHEPQPQSRAAAHGLDDAPPRSQRIGLRSRQWYSHTTI